MQNVCVFCGSSAGKDPIFMASAKALGQAISRSSMGLFMAVLKWVLWGKWQMPY